MSINNDKTKIVHFRSKNNSVSDFEFTCGEAPINYVTSYKYLGLWFDEHLNMKKAVKELAHSASRALGVLKSKFFCCRWHGF